jgi:hypothetical protein
MDCLTEMAIYTLGDLCCNLLAAGLADGFAAFAGYKAHRERAEALRRGETPPERTGWGNVFLFLFPVALVLTLVAVFVFFLRTARP